MTTLDEGIVGVGGDAAPFPTAPARPRRLGGKSPLDHQAQAGQGRASTGKRRPCPQKMRDDRLRLEARGFQAIPDAELLAHLLALVADETDVDSQARRLLQHFGSLTDVVTAPPLRVREAAGLNDHGLLVLRLLWELAARLARHEVVQHSLLATSPSVIGYCQIRLARERVDQVRVLYIDAADRLIADDLHSAGTVGHVEVYARELLRRALDLDAHKIVVARGQVTGSARLSRLDRSYIKTLEEAGKALGIRLVDYLVIGRDSHVSYRSGDRSGPLPKDAR